MLRSSIDNQVEHDEQNDSKAGISKDQEVAQDSIESMETIQKSSAADLDLFKKLQVLQHMNPAIKALMNYRGK